jgi:hypothetical protein
VTVLLALALTNGRSPKNGSAGHPHTSGPLPGISIAAPQSPTEATQRACVSVFAKLPVQLGTLAPRKTETDSSFVAAWGNPAIVLRCGVSRPAVFGTPEAAQLIDVNGVIWQPDPQKQQTVYTSVDRSAYIEVTVPAGADQPLPLLASAIAALPQLCSAADAAGNTGSKLPACK